MSARLEKLLDAKKHELELRKPELQAELDEWISRIESLYEEIARWLRPLEKKKYLSLRWKERSLEEEPFGEYKASSLVISFYNGRTVALTPIGWFVVGAKGRVDADLGDRHVMIVGSERTEEWQLVIDGTSPATTLPLTEENFEQLLEDYVSTF